MDNNELQKIIKANYLQGAHAAFLKIGSEYGKTISELEKKVFNEETLTDEERATIKNCSMMVIKLDTMEKELQNETEHLFEGPNKK